MKSAFFMASLSLSVLAALAQQNTNKIEVSYDKSSILVFESAIKPKGWNCGLKELVGVSVLENKILLQSKEEHFEETNLIVELVDGSIYAFDLIYNNNPRTTFHFIRNTTAMYAPKSTSTIPPLANNAPPLKPETPNSKLESRNVKPETSNSPTAETIAKKIAIANDYLKRIGLISRKMYLYIGGIYVFGEHIYFKVNLKNVSTVPYDIDYAQFLVKNRKSGLTKTSSASAEQLTPVFIYNSSGPTINKDQVVTLIYVFDKFTISDDKKLHLEFWEKNGDRSLELPVESIEILNAKNEL
jgi:conjugative transposon TraN protein